MSSSRLARVGSALALSLLVSAPAIAAVEPAEVAAASARPAAAQPVVLRLRYVVVAGDSQARIARRHGVALRDLQKVNRLNDRSVLRPGQALRIPNIVIPARMVARLPRPLLQRPDRLRLVPVFVTAARTFGVPPDLLMALAYRESNWNAQAISRSGAMGVGQLMPTTVDYVSVRLLRQPGRFDPWNAADNIWMSARVLRHLLDLTGGKTVRALAAYYQGFGSLTRLGILPIGQRYADSIVALRPAFAVS